MSDALTSRAAREYRDERDRQERTKGGPRLAMLHSAPPPQSEEDYDGAHAPFAPLDTRPQNASRASWAGRHGLLSLIGSLIRPRGKGSRSRRESGSCRCMSHIRQ
jgi:hypothetical protein